MVTIMQTILVAMMIACFVSTSFAQGVDHQGHAHRNYYNNRGSGHAGIPNIKVEDVTVKAGQTAAVLDMLGMTAQCRPVGDVDCYELLTDEAPSNGEVAYKERQESYRNFSNREGIRNSIDCGNKKFTNIRILYTPNKGFRGKDKFSLTCTHERMSTTYIYRVDVK